MIAILAVILAGTAPVPGIQQDRACCMVTMQVRVPESAGPVYLAGSLDTLGPWRPDGRVLDGAGRDRNLRIMVPRGTRLEYKFTLGRWEREAVRGDGTPPPNYAITVSRDTVLRHEIAGFKRDQREYLADWQGSGVKGRLVYWTDVPSNILGPTRHVEVWLPPGYDRDPARRYPVLYMHDGQNLFDPRIANTGVDWGVDEAVVSLVEKGVMDPVIVVGVWSTAERGPEYSPWHGADRYARFLKEELMPRVNREFRTLTGPTNTAVMGSSMGGLLSYYLVSRHPETFGSCGCVSTHFPLSAEVVARFFRQGDTATADTTPYVLLDFRGGLVPPPGARYWFDYGTEGLDSAYAPTHDSVRAWLLRHGKVEGRDFVVRAYPGATHNEASWRARLTDILAFLYGRNRRPLDLGVPRWSHDAIWYQIFVERFRNGDPSNDPTAHDIIGFTDERAPPGWKPAPWSHDWYAVEPWARSAGKDFDQSIQFRRYGGDLQGVMDQLDYIQSLGVTALYFNPLNDAPSLHKFDARNYRHIDRNFGPDPRGDEARIAAEDPSDPATWGWTAADSLFLALIREVHRRGMKLIVDYSWNHTGITFWAWQDVLANQAASPYAGWYEITRFDDPATPDTSEFAYRGWAGVPWLPEWKKIGRPEGQTHGPIEGTLVPGVRKLVFDVTRRWLDPNGDGDPSDGIDGFRLDVAEMVPLGFWREYRRFVRSINPEAYLVGEVWWEKWPDRIYDPRPWLQGDVFDAVMHYLWYMPTRGFFARTEPQLTPAGYAAALDSLGQQLDSAHQKAMMNLTASHDTPRFSTSIFNPGRYKYHNRPQEDSTYRVHRPDRRTAEIQRMILVQQFTWIGAPHIWYGDEVGMWGSDDPDMRKPMVWSDLAYDDERAHVRGLSRPRDRVAPDTALLRVYRDLAALRKDHLRLFVDGGVNWLVTDRGEGTLAYERVLGDGSAVVAFNRSDRAREIRLPVNGAYRLAYGTPGVRGRGGNDLRVTLPARGAGVWVRD